MAISNRIPLKIFIILFQNNIKALTDRGIRVSAFTNKYIIETINL
jgi:hypothetical protein